MLQLNIWIAIGLIAAGAACAKKPKRSSGSSDAVEKAAALEDHTYVDCTEDGQIDCITTTRLPSVEISSLPEKLVSGTELAGIEGTRELEFYSPCTQDGQSGCLIDGTSVIAVDLSQLSPADIRAGSTIAGIEGQLTEALSPCSNDNEIACLTTAAVPAIDKAKVASNLGLIASTQMIAGLQGTLSSCNTDNSQGCLSTIDFPAVDKNAKLLTKRSLFLNSASIAGITGLLNICGTDGQNACVSDGITTNAAALAGAEAKIKSGSTLAGIAGQDPVRPADCGASGAISCVTTPEFPALDKVNKLDANRTKISQSFSILGVSGQLATCGSDGASACLTDATFVAVALSGLEAKLKSGEVLAGATGTAPYRPETCALDAAVGCVSSLTFPAIDKDNVLVANQNKILNTHTIAGVTGSLPYCTTDGQANCVADGLLFAAANTVGAAAKIKDNAILAGVQGSVPLRPANCDEEAETSCVATANFPAVDKAVKITPNRGLFRSNLSIVGTSGLLDACASSGSSSCLATGSYYAATACSELGSNCYLPTYDGSTSLFKAIDFTTLTADVIKKNITIAGVLGAYPDATHPLDTADAIPDITTSNFNASMASDDDFAWYDRNGTRHAAAGDSDLIASNIRSGSTIFGAVGNLVYYPPCSGDGAINCVTTSRYKSFDTQAIGVVTAWDIRAGKQIGGIAGSLSLAKNASNTVTNFDRETGLGSIDGTDVYDTIDDYNSNSTFPSGYSFNNQSLLNTSWIRHAGSDDGAGAGVAGDGLCNGTETCIFQDRITQKYWTKDLGSKNWGVGMTDCAALSYAGLSMSDWRLPTQKELIQAHNNGIWSLKAANKLALNASLAYLSSTIKSADPGLNDFALIELHSGPTSYGTSTSNGYRTVCVHD